MKPLQHVELLGLSLEQLTDVVQSFGQASYRAHQLFDGLYRQRWTKLELFTSLPQALRRELNQAGYVVGAPQIETKFHSADGTVRYLFAFADGQSVETVWMPEGDGGEAGDGSEVGDVELSESLSSESPHLDVSPRLSSRLRTSLRAGVPAFTRKGANAPDSGADRGQEARDKSFRRATICVSSQVGCAVDCAFCMTALLGLHRNLSTGEIVGQVLAVLNDQQVEVEPNRVNLVFMGQGEPFLNYDNFMQAVRLLVQGTQIPESRMTVSTSGIVPRIADFGAEPIRPKLAVSINAPNEALRREIMPITRKWTIEKLMAALRDFPLRNRERLTFEYVLLAGVNDAVAQARELSDLLRGLRAKVNLIALNPGPEIPFFTPPEERIQAFQEVLTRAGIPTFLRRPRGRDIYAACGQLKHTTELVQLPS